MVGKWGKGRAVALVGATAFCETLPSGRALFLFYLHMVLYYQYIGLYRVCWLQLSATENVFSVFCQGQPTLMMTIDILMMDFTMNLVAMI